MAKGPITLNYILIISALLLVILFSSCSPKTGTDLNSSPVTLPEHYSQNGKEILRDSWWTGFNDPALNKLIEKSLQNNFTLLTVRDRLFQAQAVAQKTKSDLSPIVNGRFSTTESRTEQNDKQSRSTTLLLGLAANYEIDLWQQLHLKEDAAVLEFFSSLQNLQTAALSLTAQVADTWYELAQSYDQLDLLQQQQEINRLGLQLIQLRFNSGQTGLADVLQQKQLIEAKTGEQAREQASAKVLEHQLAILTGTSPGVFQLKEQPQLVKLPGLPEMGNPLDLLNNRPDIQAARFDLAAADKGLAAAMAARYPSLSLSFDLTTSGSASQLFQNWFSSVAASLVAPVFDGGNRKMEVERNRAVVQERLHQYGEAIVTAIGEVENAINQETQQQLLIDSLQLQLDLATRTVENVRNRYKLGAQNYQRVLSALLSQQTLQRELLRARQQQIGFRIALHRALGGHPFPISDTMTGL